MLIDKLRKPLPTATAPEPEQPVSDPAPGRGRHRLSGPSNEAVFRPLLQSLAAGSDPAPHAAAAGRRLAEREVPLTMALDVLRQTYRTVGEEPSFEAIRILCQSWTECTLTYLHASSCEDHGTGLATTPHLRTRLTELYRIAERQGWYLPDTHILVIAEPVAAQPCDSQLANLGGAIRTAFRDPEVIARLGAVRVAAIVHADDHLTEHLGTLRSMIGYWPENGEPSTAGTPRTKVWSERLPTLSDWSDSFVNDLALG
ncbi:hypothetical protein GCM10009742_68550 [Kribbella karoonensis]|uniref:Uncharacterized protein n=1 Tax=Kribbella karoonensis TaxID=324851 RepID=A0ABN2EIU4_9ACTN